MIITPDCCSACTQCKTIFDKNKEINICSFLNKSIDYPYISVLKDCPFRTRLGFIKMLFKSPVHR